MLMHLACGAYKPADVLCRVPIQRRQVPRLPVVPHREEVLDIARQALLGFGALALILPLLDWLCGKHARWLARRWAWLDSRERGVPALVMAPVLLLAILLGPLGLAAYLAIRARWVRPAVAVAPELLRRG